MNTIDFEILFDYLMTHDQAYYGLLGVVALLILLLAWRLSRYGVDKSAEKEIEADESRGDQIVDEMLEKIETSPVQGERIDEPQISTVPDTEDTYKEDYQREEKPQKEKSASKRDSGTDTVEVLRQLSSDIKTEEEYYDVVPVGKKRDLPKSDEIYVEEPPAKKPKKKPDTKPEVHEKKTPEAEVKSLEDGLAKTKDGFMSRLNSMVFGQKQINESILEDLEEILYQADIGSTATKLFDKVTEQLKRKELKDPGKIKEMLRAEILEILKKAEKPFTISSDNKPHVIIMIGVNGVGKTTTIGKVAKQFTDQGKHVMLAAGDTFRAAAVEQLCIWGERSGAEVVNAKEGANPSGVLYGATQSAIAKDVDLLIADTAGRLHTKYNLMEELKKMKAVTAKSLGREPDEIWLVIDANTGQNAVTQAETFHAALGLTGLVLTKLDGTAKGGVVIGITDQLGLPIRYIGIGEAVEDLRPFYAEEFVNALF